MLFRTEITQCIAECQLFLFRSQNVLSFRSVVDCRVVWFGRWQNIGDSCQNLFLKISELFHIYGVSLVFVYNAVYRFENLCLENHSLVGNKLGFVDEFLSLFPVFEAGCIDFYI